MKYCLQLSVNNRPVLELAGLYLLEPGLYIYFITFLEFYNMIIFDKNCILKINE